MISENYFIKFFIEFDYPIDTRQAILSDYIKIRNISSNEFEYIIKMYVDNLNCDFNKIFDVIKEISLKTKVHELSVGLIYYIAISEQLKKYYIKNNVSLTIWKNSVFDLKYKMFKCKYLHGVYGAIKLSWPVGFFQMRKFGLGKLQFEIVNFRRDFIIDGIVLKPNSKVINVHIPRTGSPLDRESMLDAYKMAKEFFSNVFIDNKAVFVCESWMLWERNKEILKPGSNLLSFINDYKIVETGEYPDYKETWRIFDTPNVDDLEKLPQNTSLQRAYVDIMKKGEKTGWAYGVFVL